MQNLFGGDSDILKSVKGIMRLDTAEMAESDAFSVGI